MAEPREYRQQPYLPPPGAVDLLLVRHGESAAAKDDEPFELIDGQGDPELHPNGREQAERVADRLEHEGLDAIYVSTMRRTSETAAPLVARTGLLPTVVADLREVHLGEWEGGLLRRKAAEGDPLFARIRDEERWDVIPGAEPQADLEARVRRAVSDIAAQHAGQRVAIFSHGAWIGQLLATATGARPMAFLGADNASISQVIVVGDSWVVRRFNDTSHLTHQLTRAAQAPT